MEPTRPAFAEPAGGAPSPGAYDEEPPQVPGSFLKALPQFFIFPAILVVTLTALYLLLRMLAGAEPSDARQLLADLRDAGPHGRWQVLYSLSDGLRKNLTLEAVTAGELDTLYRDLTGEGDATGEEALLRQQLLLVLAHKRDPALTPHALAALESADGGLRRGALQALAIMADPATLEPLAGVLGGQDGDERLLALGALASLHQPAAGELIAGLFLDGDTILARNAVLLAARAGDARAAPFLGAVLERQGYAADARLDGGVPGMSEASREETRADAVEAFLVEGCKAAAALGDRSLAEPLRKLREGDPSVKVRSAALDALHALDTQESD